MGSQVFPPKTEMTSANKMGIVITQKVCEIIAIEAPVWGFPPYASGKTTVFNPRGVEIAKNSKIKGVLSIDNWNITFISSFIPNKTNKITIGRIISLSAVAK